MPLRPPFVLAAAAAAAAAAVAVPGFSGVAIFVDLKR